MEEERRSPKNKNMRRIFWENLAKQNVRRCLICSLILIAFSGITLILANTIFYSEALVPYLLPGAFFAVLCGAYAFLCYSTLVSMAREVYDLVSFSFAILSFAVLCYLAILAMKGNGHLSFYYVGVVLCSYVIITEKLSYYLMEAIKVVGFLVIALVSWRMGCPLSFPHYVGAIGILIFGNILSRENHYLRAEFTRIDLRSKRETKQAERDPLTGLINRRGLERVTNRIYGVCVEQKDMVGMMIIDIDHFKKYNDGFGHLQGDKCLQAVARRISETVGNKGFTSRIGGEEFLIFVYGMTPTDMYEIAEQVRADVESMRLPHATGKGDIVTISVGCYIDVPEPGTSFTSLYGRADKLLYKSKTTGRNKVTCNRKISRPPAKSESGDNSTKPEGSKYDIL